MGQQHNGASSHHLVEEIPEGRSKRSQDVQIVRLRQIRNRVYKESAAFKCGYLEASCGGRIHRYSRLPQNRRQTRAVEGLAVLLPCDHQGKQVAAILESEVYVVAAMVTAFMRQNQRKIGWHMLMNDRDQFPECHREPVDFALRTAPAWPE